MLSLTIFSVYNYIYEMALTLFIYGSHSLGMLLRTHSLYRIRPSWNSPIGVNVKDIAEFSGVDGGHMTSVAQWGSFSAKSGAAKYGSQSASYYGLFSSDCKASCVCVFFFFCH